MIKVRNKNAAISVLQRTKQTDGSYVITLPVNTSEEVYTDMSSGEVLADRLENIIKIESAMLDDMTTIILNLSSLVTGQLKLNHIYRDDFKSVDGISLTLGEHEQGSISGHKISYQLASGISRSTKPNKIIIKDVKSREVTEDEVSVYVSINFEDLNVYWIDCTNEYLNKQAITIPRLDGKEDDKPWSINVKFVFNCEETPISISDLIIAHV